MLTLILLGGADGKGVWCELKGPCTDGVCTESPVWSSGGSDDETVLLDLLLFGVVVDVFIDCVLALGCAVSYWERLALLR